MPDMSVIVLTPDDYATIQHLMASLAAQTVRGSLEVIIVAPRVSRLQADEAELAGFAAVQLLEADVMRSTAQARAAGIRAATAPIVAFTEDHSFPEPAWAESLILAHHSPWAVVGPAVGNANPRSSLSWANFLVEYVEWLHPVSPGPAAQLPGHNSAYKREMLLRYGPALGEWLEVESVLHHDLRANGYGLYLEPAARTLHLNFSRLSAAIPLRFWGGRLFAARRRHDWAPARRLLYVVGAPLIPIVRLARILRRLQAFSPDVPSLVTVLPLTALLLACDAGGELVGYLLGAGTVSERLADLDFRRERFMSRADRHELASRLAAPHTSEGVP